MNVTAAAAGAIESDSTAASDKNDIAAELSHSELDGLNGGSLSSALEDVVNWVTQKDR